MKLKYYLRGLGIGIVVTALLMGIAMKDNGKMSDEEIKARATELGMVEQLTLADMKENMGVTPTKEPVANQPPEDTKAPEIQPTNVPEVPRPTEEPIGTEEPLPSLEPVETRFPTEPIATQAPTEKPVSTEEPKNTKQPAEEDKTQPLPPTAEVSGDVVLITIHEGNNSVNVSRVLEQAGLIENATTFDRYLRNNGYSKIINTGSYRIVIGTSEAEIARIITNTN